MPHLQVVILMLEDAGLPASEGQDLLLALNVLRPDLDLQPPLHQHKTRHNCQQQRLMATLPLPQTKLPLSNLAEFGQFVHSLTHRDILKQPLYQRSTTDVSSGQMSHQ